VIDAILKSAQKQVIERLASPLMGSFLISWPLWNYRFFVALFSQASVTNTFRLIDTVVYPHWWSFPVYGFGWPLVTALVYIFVYPYPARLAYRFSYEQQKKINDDRRGIEGLTFLTLEESRRIRAELARRENEHEAEIDKKNKEIDQLRERLNALRQGANSALPPPPPEPTPPLSKIDEFPTTTVDIQVPSESERAKLLASKINSDALRRYTEWKFPTLPVSVEWNDRAIRDLDGSTYATLEPIDRAVDRAAEAVAAYAREKPEWFKTGTDYVTKSLGFVDAGFRVRHGFAPLTREAFERYSHLLKP
jgi:hypothetical protein